jgi:hypothetical protein
MWISEVLVVFITECYLIFEDMEMKFHFQNFHIEGVHAGQYNKIRPSTV